MAEKASSFYKGQIAVRDLGRTTCTHHKGNILDWVCETCCDAICAKCVSSLHKGHDIVHLSETTADNKRKIKIFIDEVGQKELRQIQQEIISTRESLENDLSHFESVRREMKEQGETLKEYIDVLMARTLSHIKQLEDENANLLKNYRIDLEQKLAELKDQLKHCNEALKTGTDIQVFDFVFRLQTNITLHAAPILASAVFSPNVKSKVMLEQAYGKVIVDKSGQSEDQSTCQQDIDSDQSQETPDHQVQVPPLQQSKKESPQMKINQLPLSALLAQSTVLSESIVSSEIESICPTCNDGAWTSGRISNIVTHLTSQGGVHQKIQSHVPVTDICISPSTHNLWACSNKEYNVMELTLGTLISRFKTTDEPRCLCVTKDDCVLVGSKHKITEYTKEGKKGLVSRTYLYFMWNPLLKSPWRMSQCPVSKNIAAVDMDLADDGGKGEPAVIVLNKRLKELFRYGRPNHIIKCESGKFCAADVAYDSLGQLVIADTVNSLHLLSGDGQYLRMLHTDIARPWVLCVDREGVLWAGFGRFRVEKVKRLLYTNF
ncbi:uncharacterized protein LOC110450686 isoform X1 [Mizuhopecten yessoensis]|uniref:uncharacterized protein LOC110450686 isoform X1 n=1 Tax=Mizuhopecten yessoensis TaxID=6573 RepID=UPI000B45BDD8|nr:uncharacterized protein LOC110450686 isoform X1 [Mizuhopecten yessoensis]